MSTHNITFQKVKKNNLKLIILSLPFQGTKERVRNSRGRRAISVRATEVLLYIILKLNVAGLHFVSL